MRTIYWKTAQILQLRSIRQVFSPASMPYGSIGFKTGSLDQVMSDIAELYQEDLDNRMSNTLSILEPTLVIALSLVVGFILLSVMLPLVGIMSSI